jgi:hypothetical protein
VPLAAPAPVRQPTGVARGAAPAAAHGRGNVVPIRRSTVQLVRPAADGRDHYQDYLEKIPDIQPGGPGSHLLEGLVPDEEEIRPLLGVPTAVNENTVAHEDPALDAFGGRAVSSTSARDLVPGAGGGESA